MKKIMISLILLLNFGATITNAKPQASVDISIESLSNNQFLIKIIALQAINSGILEVILPDSIKLVDGITHWQGTLDREEIKLFSLTLDSDNNQSILFHVKLNADGQILHRAYVAQSIRTMKSFQKLPQQRKAYSSDGREIIEYRLE
jgi:hypothetical protein